jgi:hypothetical protein
VGISDSVIITCSSELCVQVVNKSIHRSKPPSIVMHIHMKYVLKYLLERIMFRRRVPRKLNALVHNKLFLHQVLRFWRYLYTNCYEYTIQLVHSPHTQLAYSTSTMVFRTHEDYRKINKSFTNKREDYRKIKNSFPTKSEDYRKINNSFPNKREDC